MSSTPHEVISTFLDDEPFDPRDLANVLADPAGRALLIDLIVLRQIVQPPEAVPPIRVPAPARRPGWWVAAAAAALVGVAGGYLLGENRSSAVPTAAPAATRVVQATPFTPDGGSR